LFGSACGGSGIVTIGAGVSAGACARTTGGGTAGPGVHVGGVHVSWLEEALEPHVALVEKLLYSAQLFL
jgi:hypothetical protein